MMKSSWLTCRWAGWVAVVMLGPKGDAARGTVEDVLAPLSSPACNAHLVLLLLDLLMVTLFPELAAPLPLPVPEPVGVAESRASSVRGSASDGDSL